MLRADVFRKAITYWAFFTSTALLSNFIVSWFAVAKARSRKIDADCVHVCTRWWGQTLISIWKGKSNNEWMRHIIATVISTFLNHVSKVSLFGFLKLILVFIIQPRSLRGLDCSVLRKTTVKRCNSLPNDMFSLFLVSFHVRYSLFMGTTNKRADISNRTNHKIMLCQLLSNYWAVFHWSIK